MYHSVATSAGTDGTEDSLFIRTDNTAPESEEVVFRLMPADILTTRRYVEGWLKALEDRFNENTVSDNDSPTAVDSRAKESAFELARRLIYQPGFPPGFPDVELQPDDDGGVVFVMDNLPAARRVILEINPGGNDGRLKFVEPDKVSKFSITLSQGETWIAECLHWLEAR